MLQRSHCFGSRDTCHFGSRCARYGHCAALILPLLLACGWRCRPDPDHHLDLNLWVTYNRGEWDKAAVGEFTISMVLIYDISDQLTLEFLCVVKTSSSIVCVSPSIAFTVTHVFPCLYRDTANQPIPSFRFENVLSFTNSRTG